MHEQNQFSAFFAGALIGAGIALILAPQTGAQLRRSLRDYASDATSELEHLADRGTAAWDDMMEQGEEYVERGAEAVKDTAKKAERYAEGAAQRTRQAVRQHT